MTSEIKTFFDGEKIIVPQELRGHKPTELTLILGDESKEKKGLPLLDEMTAISKRLKGNYPEDLAKNHDYYLHGRRKFEN